MNVTGTVMGGATIPMALLNVGSFAAGLWLIGTGAASQVAVGVLFGLVVAVIARQLPEEDSALADIAYRAGANGQRATSYAIAILNSIGPVLAIMFVELLVLRFYQREAGSVALWLWSYGIATGAWSLRARRADPRHRTLCGIQAWSAQLSYALLSLAVLVFHWPVAIGLLSIAVPMTLPLVAGTMLALADRNALRDVQI